MKPLIFTFLAISLASFVSCGHVYTKKETYQNTQGVDINGASISSAVDPQGDKGSMSFSAMIYMAGGAKLVGPFLWRIEAEGKEGLHETLTVHKIKVSTEKTKRAEWFPQKHLGSVTFKALKKEPGVAFAAFQLPGKLEVYPEKDGPFTVIADVSVKSKLGTERKLVKFRMVPSKESDTEFIFLPAEIAKGWKPSPRDWQWSGI